MSAQKANCRGGAHDRPDFWIGLSAGQGPVSGRRACPGRDHLAGIGGARAGNKSANPTAQVAQAGRHLWGASRCMPVRNCRGAVARNGPEGSGDRCAHRIQHAKHVCPCVCSMVGLLTIHVQAHGNRPCRCQQEWREKGRNAADTPLEFCNSTERYHGTIRGALKHDTPEYSRRCKFHRTGHRICARVGSGVACGTQGDLHSRQGCDPDRHSGIFRWRADAGNDRRGMGL